jgi:thiamine-phosphate pyrophosphorylase
MTGSIPRLYVILDAALIPSREADVAAQLAEAGVPLIQYRNKKATSRELFDISRAISGKLSRYAVRFIVNDRPDIAVLADAGGVHLGQEDLPVAEARRICGPDRLVGISTHDLAQVRAADQTGADYIAIGPIFATATKENPEAVVGAEFIRRARELTRKPLVGIGGITVDRAREVYAAGADCVCVARDLLKASDLTTRAQEYLALSRELFPK